MRELFLRKSKRPPSLSFESTKPKNVTNEAPTQSLCDLDDLLNFQNDQSWLEQRVQTACYVAKQDFLERYSFSSKSAKMGRHNGHSKPQQDELSNGTTNMSVISISPETTPKNKFVSLESGTISPTSVAISTSTFLFETLTSMSAPSLTGWNGEKKPTHRNRISSTAKSSSTKESQRNVIEESNVHDLHHSVNEEFSDVAMNTTDVDQPLVGFEIQIDCTQQEKPPTKPKKTKKKPPPTRQLNRSSSAASLPSLQYLPSKYR